MSDSKNDNDQGCVDCGAALPPFEVYACDMDCKSEPLCQSCYEDNHADGGCLLETEDPDPYPDELDARADRFDQADRAWMDEEALHG
jgi:hypothetical protein